MKKIIFLVLVTSFLAACHTREHAVLVSAQEDAAQTPVQLVSQSTRGAAIALLNALTDEQKKLALHDIKAPLKKDWHFIPRDRQGLKLGDMTAGQKTLFHNLMQTALSDSGYLKATDIIWLETVLYEMSNQSPGRDPGNYVIQIFGDPTKETTAWGWRLEGHHLSLNLTYTPEGIGVTPLFFGTNPAVVQQGPLAGKRVLAEAHSMAIELAQSMDEEQREKMMLAEKPRDIVTGPGREASLQKPAGIKVQDLKLKQVLLLVQLFEVHTWDNFNVEHSMSPIRLMEQKDLDLIDEVSFAWAGPIDSNKPFYYRIHYSGRVVEYSCQGKNHVHAVIHDLTDPLQEDLLKKHFEQHEH